MATDEILTSYLPEAETTEALKMLGQEIGDAVPESGGDRRDIEIIGTDFLRSYETAQCRAWAEELGGKERGQAASQRS